MAAGSPIGLLLTLTQSAGGVSGPGGDGSPIGLLLALTVTGTPVVTPLPRTPPPSTTAPEAAPDRGWEEYFKFLGEERLARLRREDDDIIRLMELENELVLNMLKRLH